MWKKFGTPFFICVSTFLLFGFFSIFFFDALHDAVVLIPAIAVLDGKTLFKETFTQYGALFTYVHAFAMALFGAHVLTIRLVTLLFYSGTAVILWSIYKRLLSRQWNLLAFCLWLSLSPVYRWYFQSWSSVPAAFFQCFSLLMVLWFIEKKQQRYILYAGIASVLAFWFRQPVGVVNILMISIGFGILWITKSITTKEFISIISTTLLAIAIGFVSIFILIVAQGAAYDWWLQSIMMTIPWAQTVRGMSVMQGIKSLGMARYWRDWQHILPYIIWFIVPINTVYTVCSTILTLLRKDHQKKTIQLLFVGLVGIGSWHQYYPVGEPIHYFWACIPMIGLFVYTLYRATRSLIPQHEKIVLCIAFIVILINLGREIYTGITRVSAAQYRTSVIPVLYGVPMLAEQKQFYDTVAAGLTEIFSKYPGKTYINDSGNAIYPLFSPDHFVSFHGIYADWDFITSTADPLMQKNKQQYIQSHRPLIFSRYHEKYPDYCDLKVASLDQPRIKLLVPKELIEGHCYYDTTGNP